jgi:N-acetylneuraminate synthase
MNREVLGKSLVAARPIRKGQKITRDMITAKSPGKGISPQRLEELVGVVARRDLAPDDYFIETDFGTAAVEGKAVDFPAPWGLIVRFSDVDKLAAFGPQIVEFHLTEGDLARRSLDGRHTQKLAVHMAEYVGENLVDLCSRDDELRARSIRRIEEVIELARGIAPAFDTSALPKIVVHPGGMSFEPESKKAAVLLENLADSLGRIDARGVELLLENMPPFPWYFGGQWYHNIFVDAAETAEFCRRAGVGVCLDVSHAQLACAHLGRDLVDYVTRLKPLTRHVHLADAAGKSGEGLQIGEGEIDFEKLWPHLEGIDGYFIPEIWQGHKFGGEGFLVALTRLSEIAAKHRSRPAARR